MTAATAATCVPCTRSAAGLRAQAAAIRPTAADYLAAAVCGAGMADLVAREESARHLERAAAIRGRNARASYLRFHGFSV